METKTIKQIVTSCPFPLLIYPTNIRYYEVRKASGIAYMLLEMIDKATDSADKISDVLLKFGIPVELHHIFGKEIAGLIDTDIIESPSYPSAYFNEPRYFSQIRMGEIKLTQKGKTMFRDKAIPTGQEKGKQKDIYFDPIRRKFDIDSSFPYADISTSALGEEFVDKLDLDLSGMEDYINANSTKMGLKPEEIIISFECEAPQKKAIKPQDNVTIVITQAGVEFKFATSDETAFFKKYFTSELMKQVMLYKTKYQFVDSAKAPISVPTIAFEKLDATNLYIPDDASKQAKSPCKMFLGRDRLVYENINSAIRLDNDKAATILDELDRDAEFALLDVSGCRYYRALNVAFPCAQLGDTFEMQLLVENQVSEEMFHRSVREIFDYYKIRQVDPECSKAITYAVEALKDSELFEEYAQEKLSGVQAIDDKIELLLKLNGAFAKSAEWGARFIKLANDLYSRSVQEVKLDNMIYKNAVLTPLVKAMGMSEPDHIVSFSRNVAQTEVPELVYQALASAGFATKTVLGVVNIVEVYMNAVLNGEAIVADDELAHKFSVLQTNFDKLNEMLGIESLSDYTIKDDYNVDEFFNAYNTFVSTYKSLQGYKQYAEKEFKELEEYITIYEPIHEVLSIERTASSHPEKISVKYINNYISRGKYKDAICDLLVKLQYGLRAILQADASIQANELIDMAKEASLIDEKEMSSLHKLRICRNRFQHPNSEGMSFSKADIEKWRDIVFSIGRKK